MGVYSEIQGIWLDPGLKCTERQVSHRLWPRRVPLYLDSARLCWSSGGSSEIHQVRGGDLRSDGEQEGTLTGT